MNYTNYYINNFHRYLPLKISFKFLSLYNPASSPPAVPWQLSQRLTEADCPHLSSVSLHLSSVSPHLSSVKCQLSFQLSRKLTAFFVPTRNCRVIRLMWVEESRNPPRSPVTVVQYTTSCTPPIALGLARSVVSLVPRPTKASTSSITDTYPTIR